MLILFFELNRSNKTIFARFVYEYETIAYLLTDGSWGAGEAPHFPKKQKAVKPLEPEPQNRAARGPEQ